MFSAASKAFKKVYQHGYKPDDLFTVPEYAALVTETKTAFNPAIEYVQSDVLKSYLDQDAFVFSGLKAHKELTNARALLKDENGNIRPWNQFEQAILKLNNTYNRLYLEAEYEFAVHSAQSADRWSDLSDDTDRYWLQYRTAQDERVRENHQVLAGTTLPKDDPFWDEYYPPNGWRCRCVAVEVLARNNTKSNSAEAIKKGMEATTSLSKSGANKLAMFRFNPGKEQKLFPPKNSYMPRGCGGTLSITDAVFLALDDEACRAKKIIEERAQKQERIDLKNWAKENLKEKIFEIDNDKATITTRGIKEVINQPHKFYTDKNKVLLDLENVCKNAKHYESIENQKDDSLVKTFHYYEIKLNGEPSWIVVREMFSGERQIYTIVDSLKK